jgi:predicted metal-dependent hydrolase
VRAKAKRDVGRLFPATDENQVGSCNHRASHIRLNTETVKKPKDLLEYVIVHEMVHRLEPTHSERFVTILQRHDHKWREARAEPNEIPLGPEQWRE